jgi:cell division protein FtsW (lipid II flippase)
VTPLALPLTTNWPGVQGSRFLLGVLVLAGVGTTLVFALSVVAYRRRRQKSHLLVSVAIGLLVVRTLVGFGTVRGITPMLYHHLVEHTFDFLIAGFVLAAAYVGGAETTGS